MRRMSRGSESGSRALPALREETDMGMKIQTDDKGNMTRIVEPPDDFEAAYFMGYEHGYQMAIKEVIKKMRGMKWHGGGYKEKCAAGVPEHHEGRAEDLQHKL